MVVPAEIPNTSPVPFTVATDVFEEVHVPLLRAFKFEVEPTQVFNVPVILGNGLIDPSTPVIF